LSLLERWVKECNLPGYLGNFPASGTAILDQLGEEHLQTQKPIVYTSGDSVFQVAAHETVFGLERLYHICETARKLTLPLQIGRVIARPFLGNKKGEFKRTTHRRDYSIDPGRNCLDILNESGITVCSVGKIDDIFNHRGIHFKNHTGNNQDSYVATSEFVKKFPNEKVFIFVNLVDFDMLYGHRRDPRGYAQALVEMDQFLEKFLGELKKDDTLFITSDHGCDPTFRGTDHTREYVPLISYSPGVLGKRISDRESFADFSATLLNRFHLREESLSLKIGKLL
jgi:phosphopentomutase